MASKRIYSSEYGASRKVTAAELLAEIACGRIARQKNVTLVDRFWNDEEWLKVFRFQQRLAGTLLQVASPEAVFKVFRANAWCFSLGNKKIEEEILEEQRKIDLAISKAVAEEEKPASPPPAPATPRPIRKTGGGGLRSRLKGL